MSGFALFSPTVAATNARLISPGYQVARSNNELARAEYSSQPERALMIARPRYVMTGSTITAASQGVEQALSLCLTTQLYRRAGALFADIALSLRPRSSGVRVMQGSDGY